MKKEALLESLRQAVAQETPNILDTLPPVPAQQGRIIMLTEEMGNQKRKRTLPLLAAAAALLLVVGGGFGWQSWNAIDSRILLDVNPSLELRTNRWEKVLEVDAINEDAIKILDGMDLRGTDLKVATNAIIGSMVNQGYIDEARNSVLVTVENKNSTRSKAIQQELTLQIGDTLRQNSIDPAIVGLEVLPDSQLTSMAKSYSISEGKASLIRRLCELDTTLTPEGLAGLTVNDLSLLLVTKSPTAQETLVHGKVSDSRYIGLEKARALAEQRVPGAQITKVEFDYEDGRACYEVEGYLGGVEYEFDIDALTGQIFGWKEESHAGAPTGGPTGSGTFVGEGRAKAAALAHAGLSESQVSAFLIKLDYDDGRARYEIEFYQGSTEYDCEIDAVSGQVLKSERDAHVTTAPAGGSTTNYIGEGKAKAAALSHAGLSESQVTALRVKLDYDDGRAKYEVEFYRDSTEYDYEIDAVSGQVLKSQRDVHDGIQAVAGATTSSSRSSGGVSANYIGEGNAKAAALSHAGLTESQVTALWVRLDYDDGRARYEIEFYRGGTEYDYEIDAVSGQVLKSERDSHEGTQAPTSSTGSSSTGGGYVGEARARQVVENQLSGGTFLQLQLDVDEDGDDPAVYEGEYRVGENVYDFEVNATTGALLKWELDD